VCVHLFVKIINNTLLIRIFWPYSATDIQGDSSTFPSKSVCERNFSRFPVLISIYELQLQFLMLLQDVKIDTLLNCYTLLPIYGVTVQSAAGTI
jgi:hypothetical protein